jgi:hypothetical protein
MNRALLAFSILIAISGSTRLALSADSLHPKQIGLASAKDIYHKGWIDFNKDGKKRGKCLSPAIPPPLSPSSQPCYEIQRPFSEHNSQEESCISIDFKAI